MNFYMPVKLYTGEGCIEAHKEEIGGLGHACLIVTGAHSAVRCGALKDVTGVLDSLEIRYEIFNGIGENPELVSCREAGEKAASFGADFIIGIGGGSPMDAAKAVSVFTAYPDLTEDEFYAKKWQKSLPPVVLVGTTAGTGSEVTDVSVLTDSKAKKHSIHDPELYARLSFGDPRYTSSMPLNVTLSTGADVLAHAMESYFNKTANEISKGMALQAVRLLYAPLMHAASGEELNLSDRETLYEASILAGLAISVTGTVFPHNVGYYLTERYHVPHGYACAVFLPALIRHMDETDPDQAKAFFTGTGLTEDEIRGLIEKTLPDFDIHMTEEEIVGILPRWENNGSVGKTPGKVTTDEIGSILRELFKR